MVIEPASADEVSCCNGVISNHNIIQTIIGKILPHFKFLIIPKAMRVMCGNVQFPIVIKGMVKMELVIVLLIVVHLIRIGVIVISST